MTIITAAEWRAARRHRYGIYDADGARWVLTWDKTRGTVLEPVTVR